MNLLATWTLNLFVLAADAVPADPASQQAPAGEAFFRMMLPMLALAFIFYLLIWRPESRRRKQQEETLNSLKKKDKVVTVGGMYGTVVELDKDEVTLLVDPKKDIKIKFRRSSIANIEKAPEESEAKK